MQLWVLTVLVKALLQQLLVGEFVEVTEGTVTYFGKNLLEMAPEEQGKGRNIPRVSSIL